MRSALESAPDGSPSAEPEPPSSFLASRSWRCAALSFLWRSSHLASALCFSRITVSSILARCASRSAATDSRYFPRSFAALSARRARAASSFACSSSSPSLRISRRFASASSRSASAASFFVVRSSASAASARSAAARTASCAFASSASAPLRPALQLPERPLPLLRLRGVHAPGQRVLHARQRASCAAPGLARPRARRAAARPAPRGACTGGGSPRAGGPPPPPPPARGA